MLARSSDVIKFVSSSICFESDFSEGYTVASSNVVGFSEELYMIELRVTNYDFDVFPRWLDLATVDASYPVFHQLSRHQ